MGDIENLIETLAQNPTVLKPARHPYLLNLIWIVGASSYLLLMLIFYGLRPDILVKLHEGWFVAEIAALVGLLMSTSFVAMLLSFPDMHQKSRMIVLPMVAFAIFIAVMFFSWQADNPSAELPNHNYECTVCIILMAIVPTVSILLIMRKFASTHYHLAGLNALLSAFSLSALWLRLHETNNSIIHVAEWHYLPMIMFGLLGLWLGKICLKW